MLGQRLQRPAVIALRAGFDDRPVLGMQDRPRLRPLRLPGIGATRFATQVVDHGEKPGIAAPVVEAPMKGDVEFLDQLRILLLEKVLVQPPGFAQITIRQHLHRRAQGCHLQGCTDLGEFARLLLVQTRDRKAAVRPSLQQAHRQQPVKRLADRLAADAEALG
jgi:hypothetical protein